jgi:hypothetical protein
MATESSLSSYSLLQNRQQGGSAKRIKQHSRFNVIYKWIFEKEKIHFSLGIAHEAVC